MPETFVLDCSVAAKWILPEPGRAAALALFERYVSGEVTLIAPDILLAEFASLVAKLHRRKRLSVPQAHAAFSLLSKATPRLIESAPRLVAALDLALRHQLSLWDGFYLAVAREYGCRVLTADRRLLRGGGSRHPDIQLLE